MAVSFALEACAIMGLTLIGNRPLWFILFTGLTFFAWGQMYSLFPSAIADLFGSKYATTNFGIQYTSKGVAAVLAGPIAAWITEANRGSWVPVLWVAVGGNLVAAFLALFWLKSAARRQLDNEAQSAALARQAAESHSAVGSTTKAADKAEAPPMTASSARSATRQSAGPDLTGLPAQGTSRITVGRASADSSPEA
jgi:hypothetical protein